MSIEITPTQAAIQQRARDTYGEKNQIMVSAEELCELACVLTKFPRYEDCEKAKKELHDKVLDEVADVYSILNHTIEIFGLTKEEVEARMSAKFERLERWMNTSSSMEQTTIDREVHEINTGCAGCYYWDKPDSGYCKSCDGTPK